MTLADINWPLILAGLGLFLFGIDYMGDGLKSYAGDKLKDIIDKYTSSPVKGILIGALVTCLIQSSSGTTALTIGLIRSGLMNLKSSSRNYHGGQYWNSYYFCFSWFKDF